MMQPQAQAVLDAFLSFAGDREFSHFGVERVDWRYPPHLVFSEGVVEKTVLKVRHENTTEEQAEVFVDGYASLKHVARGLYEFGLQKQLPFPMDAKSPALLGIVDVDLIRLLVEQTDAAV